MCQYLKQSYPSGIGSPLIAPHQFKKGGSEGLQWLGISLGLWRSMAICHLNMEFVCKNLFPFPLAAAKLKVWTIRQSL
jgi:hypothetical protein